MARSSRPTEAPPPSTLRDDAAVIRTLFPYLWPVGEWGLRARVVIALVLLIGAKIATVYIPLFYKQAVDALSGEGVDASLALTIPVGAILAYGLARVLSLAFSELRDAIFAKVAQRAIRRAGLKVFEHLHALALRFHLERQTGGLARVIERGTRAIETMLSFMLFNIIPTIVEIGLVAGILWYMFDYRFAVVTLAVVVSYIGFTMWVTEWRLHFRRAMNKNDQDANTKAIDSLINYETVKYFGNERHEIRRFDEALARYETAAVRSRSSLSLLNIGQATIISAGLALIMYMAAAGIVDGTMTVGDFVLVNTYLIQLYQPLNFFGFVYREIKQGLVDMRAMFDLLAIDREVSDATGAQPLVVGGAAVVFDNVHFSYDSRRPILKGVSISVPPGKTVAIVGPTWAGKSTISRLLYRFYDVDANTGGGILIDDQDIRAVTQDSLRAAIGIVPQDTVLFNDTIAYNIAYGRPGASQDEVEKAARMARIHDFVIGLPDGYQTMVGERGLKLSGGEKQRVAIARTILKQPRILIFDEATSALDTRTEQEIQANLREVAEGRTTIVIAHRLSTIVDADEIVVLQNGEVAERGDHDTLLAKQGLYHTLWHRQQAGQHIGSTEGGGDGAA